MIDLISALYGILIFARFVGLVTWSWWIVLAPLYLAVTAALVLRWRSR